MKNIRIVILCGLLCICGGTMSAATKTLHIVANSASSYSIVYPSGNSTMETFATTLQTAIKNRTGAQLTVKTDATTAKAKEIVLGPTSTRAEHAEIKAEVPTYGFRIAIVDEKLIITASDNNHMAVALERLEAAVLTNDTVADKGFFTFNSVNDQYGDFDETQATLSSIIRNGYSYSLSLKWICSQPADGSVYVAQGCATDGTYIYLCNRTQGDVSCRIYKFKMDGTYVKKSGLISGHHANDITMDTRNNRIVLVHGSGATKTLSFIDATSLKETGTMTFGRGIGAIAYSPERDMYAGSQSGSIVFYTGADLDYSSTYKYDRSSSEGTSSYTAQGMGCDREFVYFPMSLTGTNNKLVAYDWNGNYEKTFTISSTLESESMCEYGGRYFINFYSSGNGAKFYEIVVTLKYKTSL